MTALATFLTDASALPRWFDRAACTEQDPELFFDPSQARAAVQVCADCLVRVECLAHALERGEQLGVWGGKTERQRRDLRTRARGAARG